MVSSVADFHFLRPAWLLALLVVPLLPWLWRRLGEAAGGWSRVVDPHLLAHQLQRGGRRSRSPLLLALLAWVLAVLALAGPAWRELPQPLQQREAALAVVLEVSDSMRAGDLKPTRLARARFALTDLLRARQDGQVALVAYAGAAFTVAPVTDDAGTLLALLDALDPQQMPVPGARADLAIAHAVELLERAGFEEGEILLVTDGVDTAARRAAQAARERGYAVSVLGVGTASGAPVALPDGGFLKDASGTILVPAMDATALVEVADAGGGRYSTLGTTGPGAAIDLLDRVGGRYQQDDDAVRAFVDDGPWLLLLLLPLAALGFRRGWLGCLLLAGLLPPPAAHAFDFAALWQRDDQRAWDALQDGEHERAAALATSPALGGSALFRAGEAEAAAEAFARAPGADGHYNRGNALAAAARYEEALDAYAAALATDPQLEDAAANKRAIEEWLRQQQSQPQSGEGDPSEQESGEGEQQQPQEGEGEPKDGEKSQQQQQGGQPQEQSGRDGKQSGDDPQQEGSEAEQPQDAGEDPAQEQQFGEQMQQAIEQAGEREGEAAAVAVDPADAEQRQAVEQWLRRVPDDPGGLLRRKFLIEHQRREREGEQP